MHPEVRALRRRAERAADHDHVRREARGRIADEVGAPDREDQVRVGRGVYFSKSR